MASTEHYDALMAHVTEIERRWEADDGEVTCGVAGKPITYADLVALAATIRPIGVPLSCCGSTQWECLRETAPRPVKRLSPLQRLVAWVTSLLFWMGRSFTDGWRGWW